MSLYNLIAAGHNGQCFALLARRFMIGEPQAARGVRMLLPALLPGFEAWIETRSGMTAFLTQLSRGSYHNLLSSPAMFSNHFERERGLQLIETLRSAREIDGADLARAVESSGLNYRVLLQMAPFAALLMLAAIRTASERPMREIVMQRFGERLRPSSDPFADLVELLALEAKSDQHSHFAQLLNGLLSRTTSAPTSISAHPA